MKEVLSKSGEYMFGLTRGLTKLQSKPAQYKEYAIQYIPAGKGCYHADFGVFPFEGPVLLFATPLQTLKIDTSLPEQSWMLRFHGDFYCIEYHRAEVCCNGLLFNNIYIEPSVNLTINEAREFELLLSQIVQEFEKENPSEIVIRAYLQLFLAKSSTIKMRTLSEVAAQNQYDQPMERFRVLVDEHYLLLRKPKDYASLLGMAPNTLTKRCNSYYKKPPSHLITERLILEAKKQLHLTRKSIKEIAFALNFEDEFYFSRVFKRFTKVSPQAFRDMTGISVVADSHM
ncbi:helix-turn-helix domain-containing protein [Pedobacter ginsengisoli]|uniref:helix-turn-helix domain-containing protein n=1 Tax=Pedobacter ginsengisoli TaxID=363852 RepID=UPI00254EF8DB|nr:AraC family transcriptional regulator [Pedobacter ginsengisoli]